MVTVRVRLAVAATRRGRHWAESSRVSNVSTGKAGHHTNATRANCPLLSNDVPVTDISPCKVERDRGTCTWLQVDLLKTSEHFDWSNILVCGLRQAKVELWHCIAGDRASVCDRGCDAV